MGLVMAAILAVMVCGAYFALDPRWIPITAVVVRGDLRNLSREQLERAVEEHIGGGFFSVDLDAVRNAALGLAWVKDVAVRRHWPERLTIDVREREVVARWAMGGLVDADGVLFNPLDARVPPDLPELSGPEGTQGLLLRRYREISGWIAPFGHRIARLTMSGRRSWRSDLTDGMKLNLGREPSEDGVRHFFRSLPVILEQGGEGINAVDLRYPNGFAIERRRSADGGGNNKHE